MDDLEKEQEEEEEEEVQIEEDFNDRYVDDELEMLKLVAQNEKCFRIAAKEALEAEECLALKHTKMQKLEEGSLGY